MNKTVLSILIIFVLILPGCVNEPTELVKNFDKAEKSGLVENVEKTVYFDDFIYTVTKVYNDVTGYMVFYNQNELNKKYKTKFIFTDDLGNSYQTIRGRNEKTAGYLKIDKIVDYNVKKLYLDLLIYEEVPVKGGGYREQTIDTKRLTLPVKFSNAYKNAIDIKKTYKTKVGNSYVDINRIAFGKTSTLVEYESSPDYVKIDKVKVDNILYEEISSSGSSSGSLSRWKCQSVMDAIDNPKWMEIYLIDEEGNSESVIIEIEWYNRNR